MPPKRKAAQCLENPQHTEYSESQEPTVQDPASRIVQSDQAPSPHPAAQIQAPRCVVLSQPPPSPSLKAMCHAFKIQRQAHYHQEVMDNLREILKVQKKVKKTLTTLKQQQQQLARGGVNVRIDQGAVAPSCSHRSGLRSWRNYQRDRPWSLRTGGEKNSRGKKMVCCSLATISSTSPEVSGMGPAHL